MSSPLLLDTHILLHWLKGSKGLSREQLRALRLAVAHTQAMAFSAITLLELATLARGRKVAFKEGFNRFLDDLQRNPLFRLLPLSYEIAVEVASLAALQDPADRVIVATARIHRLRLVTSDQRIIDSNLIPVID